MKIFAIILAAGKGIRFGGNIPKQFTIIEGKKMYAHSVETFSKHPLIDNILLVVPDEYKNEVVKDVENNKWKKVTDVITGGKERFNSTINALNALSGEKDNTIVLFHDAARPYVNSEIIDRVLQALQTANAATSAVKTTDTIATTSMKKQQIIKNIPDRNTLYNIQTPQGFRISTIRKAYEKAVQDKYFTATDDCGVVLKYLPKEKISISEGSYSNTKYTF